MNTLIKDGERVTASMVGDIVEVSFADVVWRIRVTLDEDAVILSDVETGAELHQGDIAQLGITRIRNRYHPTHRDLAQLLASFVVAWIVLHPKH